MDKAVIFFRGIPKNGESIGQIDETAATTLAHNRGAEPLFYNFEDWPDAAVNVASFPKRPYYLCGFSRGAAADIMGGFMKVIRHHNYRLPEDLMTVGLYGPTPRYRDPHFECVNFLDSSGQQHVREHDPVHYVNLGADVSHLPEGTEGPKRGGMAIVADMFADGKNPLEKYDPDFVAKVLAADAAPVEARVKNIDELHAFLDAPSEKGTQVSDAAPAQVNPVPAGTPVRSVALFRQNWPTQANLRSFYGAPGSHLTEVPCPWPLHILGKTRTSIEINEKCAASLARVLAWVWEECGKDIEKIKALRYDRFSGSYVGPDRTIVGGSGLSTHAYGAAIDFDDADNGQGDHHPLFTPKSPLIQAFLDEGWTWGGSWSGKTIDAMHVQAARVR